MAPHPSPPSPTTASLSGKPAVIPAPPIPQPPSSSSATATSASPIPPALSSGSPTPNFVLRNSTGVVWSTFDNPTDTLLPNQNFTSSQKLESGLYSFRLLRSGNLTLRWNDSIEYWNSGVNSHCQMGQGCVT
ncbi:hypothetical protein CsSME_00015576 [Camellia sinensis var. sinensis]